MPYPSFDTYTPSRLPANVYPEESPSESEEEQAKPPAHPAQLTKGPSRPVSAPPQQVKKPQGGKKWEGEDDEGSEGPVVRPLSLPII